MKDSWHRSIEKIPIRVFDGEKISEAAEPAVRELSFDLNVNGRGLVSLACTGIHLEELAAGWLRSEGMVSSSGDIRSIAVEPEAPRASVVLKKSIAGEKIFRSIGSSGGRGISPLSADAGGQPPLKGREGDVRISPKRVLILMRGLMRSGRIHNMTRGTHCSALADAVRIIASREDIGRHNTIDMLGGYALLNGIDCADKILLTTGRVSSEIIFKARRIGVPFIISHSAATAKAVKLSRDFGMTLVGYVRGGRFKIYAGEHRIATKEGRKRAN
jgi:FdhD protein